MVGESPASAGCANALQGRAVVPAERMRRAEPAQQKGNRIGSPFAAVYCVYYFTNCGCCLFCSMGLILAALDVDMR